ncbi:MAG TPA: SRPBCC family protein [Caulobacteraceae bacterium]|nr:SRPBCC family protein [Caulobacteraceae bacterium]
MSRRPVEVSVTAHSNAPPSAVYAVAADSENYPRWSRIGSFEHARDGEAGRYGVGSRRIYRTWPLKLLEEVVELIPERRVGYILISGLPFDGYHANIDLTPADDGGTIIRWSNRFVVTWPMARGFFAAFMRGVFAEMAPQLAHEAERIETSRAP